MDYLTDEQIDYIVDDLRRRGLHYAPLVDELLDHVCCLVESEVAAGTDFEVAYRQTIQAFGRDGIQKTQTLTFQSVNNKTKRMRRLKTLLTGIAACMPLLTLNVGAVDPPRFVPT